MILNFKFAFTVISFVMGFNRTPCNTTYFNQSERRNCPIYQSAVKLDANHYVHVTFPALFSLTVPMIFSQCRIDSNIVSHCNCHWKTILLLNTLYHKTVQRNPPPPPPSPTLSDLLRSSTSDSRVDVLF